jgi:hypothetical protein
MKPLIRVSVLRPFEDNFGRIESPVGVVMRKAGDLVPSEDVARYAHRYLANIERAGRVKIEKLSHCPTCGHELPAPADDKRPNSFSAGAGAT